MQNRPPVSVRALVLLAELTVKFPINVLLYVIECGDVKSMLNELVCTMRRHPMAWAQMCIPALLYTVGATLQGFGAAHLDAPIAQLIFQSRILFTAVCAVLLLDKVVTRTQWVALIVLTLGVVSLSSGAQLLHSPRQEATVPPPLLALPPSGPTRRQTRRTKTPSLGVAAYLSAALCSALSSVYLERLIKRHVDSAPPSLWLRQIQLGLPSIVIAAGLMVANGETHDPFRNIDALAFVTVPLWGGFGGIIIALVLKHADSLLRGFGAAVATLIATLGSTLFLGFELTPSFAVGASLVLFSMLAYAAGGEKRGGGGALGQVREMVPLTPSDVRDEDGAAGAPRR